MTITGKGEQLVFNATSARKHILLRLQMLLIFSHAFSTLLYVKHRSGNFSINNLYR